jgi:hypothetical protein
MDRQEVLPKLVEPRLERSAALPRFDIKIKPRLTQRQVNSFLPLALMRVFSKENPIREPARCSTTGTNSQRSDRHGIIAFTQPRR